MRSPEHSKRLAEERVSTRPVDPKCDRAYDLHRKDVSNWAIAERLGMSQKPCDGSDQAGQGT